MEFLGSRSVQYHPALQFKIGRVLGIMTLIFAFIMAACGGGGSQAVTGTSQQPEDCCRVAGVDIPRDSVVLEVGGTKSLKLEVRSSDGSLMERSGVWFVEDSTVATITVGEPVKVSGVAAGSTNVVGMVTRMADTVGVAVKEPVFRDDFSGGTLASSQEGFGWGSQSEEVSLSPTAGRGGSGGLVITYPGQPDGEDAWPRIDLSFGEELEEVWVSYWMKVPDNFIHRDQEGPTNNKFFGLWRSGARKDQHSMIPEYNQVFPGGDQDREESYLDWEKADESGHEKIMDPFITAGDHGTWMHIRWHVRVADIGSDNGVIEFWKNGVKQFSRSDVKKLYTDTGDPANNHYSYMRLLGWANSGFDEETTFVFDEVKIYTSNPGW